MHLMKLAAALLALSAISLAPASSFAQSAQPDLTPPAFNQPGGADPFSFQQSEPARIVRTEPQRRLRHAAREHRVVHRQKPDTRDKRAKRKTQENVQAIAIGQGYKKVSDLVQFPAFFPGLGIIYVKPDTLPLGPFLCFDRRKKLVATVYMVPIKDIDDHKTFDGTAPAFAPRVDHTTMYFNAGHPGVDVPHYHIVLWHVSKDGEQRVAH